MLPLAAAFVCFGDWISVFLLGENWTTSGEVVRYLALGEVPTLLMMALVRGNAAVGRPAKGLYVTLGILPVLIGGVFLWAEDGAIAVAQFIVVLRWVCMPLYLWMYLREVGFSRKEYLSKMLHLIAIFSLLVLCGLCGRYFVVTSTIIFQFIIGLSFLGLSYLFFTFFYAISRVGSEILVWMLEAVEMVFRLIGSNVFADVTKSLGRFILKLRSNG
jgi:O-antigen/teichoic acid export membrane protein